MAITTLHREYGDDVSGNKSSKSRQSVDELVVMYPSESRARAGGYWPQSLDLGLMRLKTINLEVAMIVPRGKRI